MGGEGGLKHATRTSGCNRWGLLGLMKRVGKIVGRVSI
jgi:hypothetical protein